MSADAGLSFSSADVVSHSTIGAVFGRRDIATGPTGLALTRAALRYWTGANFSHLKGAAKTNKEKQHGEHSARRRATGGLAYSAQTRWGVPDSADRRRRAEHGVEGQLPVQLRDRWQGGQDHL